MTAEARGDFAPPPALRRWIPVATAVAVLVGVAALVIGRELVSPAPPAPTDPPARATSELVRFRDAAGAISISHPADWQRLASPDTEVRLLVEGDGSSMQVRMVNLGVEVGPGNLAAAKRLTDKLVRSAGQAKLLRPPEQVILGGLSGYLYLYTFRDRATGRRGAHAHYFLFRGQTLITVVFQASPAERLVELAPQFDRIAETLRSGQG